VDREIEYQQFEQGGPEGLAGEVDLRRVSEIPMELSVEIGRTQMTVGETLSLREGAVVVLDRLAGEPVDLLVNGTPIARGEVVVVDEKFGLRVKQILEGTNLHDEQQQDASTSEQLPGAAAAQVGEGSLSA
jgi:flagellar motor switch protein FliN/FliY